MAEIGRGDRVRSYLPIVLRAYTERQTKPTPNPKIRRQPEPKWPNVVLLLDTETTTDPTQRLLFGSYRYCRWKDRLLQCVEEGIFYADELPESSPDGFACLQRYVREHQADVIRGARQGFLLVSRHDFVTQKFLPAAYEGRALVVGFNLHFDLARLAIDWKAARKLYEGEFSLPLCEYQKDGVKQENLFKPRLCFKSIDSKRSLMGFARPRGEARTEGDYFFGYLLDARTLAFSLTNEGYPLGKA